jgi:hypothetical protein
MAVSTLSFGFLTSLFDNDSTGPGLTSEVFALPGNPASLVSYQISFDVVPSAVQVDIQVSLDGISFFTIKSITSTAGAADTIRVAFRFLRVTLVSQTGAGALTVKLLTKPSFGEAPASTGGGTGSDINLVEIDGNAVNVGSGAVASGTQRTVTASNSPDVAVLGTTSGAAVITDSAGTIQQYLRGLIKLATTAGSFLVTTVLAAGSNVIGKVGIDQTTPGTTNKVDASGSTGLVVSSLPALPAGTNLIGNVGTGKVPKSKTGSASATFTAVAAVASNKIKVYAVSLMTVSATAVTVTFKDGASGTVLATYLLQASASVTNGIAESVAIPSSLFETTVNTLLEMSFSAAVSVSYNIRYFEDA